MYVCIYIYIYVFIYIYTDRCIYIGTPVAREQRGGRGGWSSRLTSIYVYSFMYIYIHLLMVDICIYKKVYINIGTTVAREQRGGRGGWSARLTRERRVPRRGRARGCEKEEKGVQRCPAATN